MFKRRTLLSLLCMQHCYFDRKGGVLYIAACMVISTALMRARRQSARWTRAPRRDWERKKSWMDYVWGFIALTCYRTGGRNWDRGGRGGKIGWVRASMRGPTSCHMRTEKQHLIVSSLGRPPEKRGAAEGDKSMPAPSATTRTRPPLPRWPALVFAGGNVNFSCPERRTLSTVFVIQHACAILLLERWARRYRDSRVQVSQIQNGRSSWAQTRTRKAGCSNLGSLRPDQQLTPYDGPLSGTHSLTYCLKSCRALGATTVQPVV